MSVLVDTTIWSFALRRNVPHPTNLVAELRALIADGRAKIIGPIRQEVLSGIRSDGQFEEARRYLAAFSDLPLETE